MASMRKPDPQPSNMELLKLTLLMAPVLFSRRVKISSYCEYVVYIYIYTYVYTYICICACSIYNIYMLLSNMAARVGSFWEKGDESGSWVLVCFCNQLFKSCCAMCVGKQ